LMAYELFSCPRGRRSRQAVCVPPEASVRLPGRELRERNQATIACLPLRPRRLHGRDSRARNAPPRLRPTPVRRDQRGAVAQRTERSRAATRREPVPRFRRQLLIYPVLRESVSWLRSWCGSPASAPRRMASWTVEWTECGECSFAKPLRSWCCDHLCFFWYEITLLQEVLVL